MSIEDELTPVDLIDEFLPLTVGVDVADIELKPYSHGKHAVLYLKRDGKRADAAYVLIKELAPAGSVFDLWTYLKDLPAE